MRDDVMNAGSTAAEEEHPPLSMCLTRLAEINRLLSQGSVDVERALTLYEEGMGLHVRAESILSQARLRIRRLAGQGEDAPESGEPILAPEGAPLEDELPF